MSATPQIIIIKTEPRIDILRATSLLEPLREQYPGCSITWVTSRRNGLLLKENLFIERLLFAEDANDATNERIRVRRNTSASAIQATTAIKTSRVVTLILTGGEIVEVMDTSGTTPPTPASGASGTLMVGADTVGLVQAAPDYQNNGLRAFVSSGDTADLTVTRLLIQRLQ